MGLHRVSALVLLAALAGCATQEPSSPGTSGLPSGPATPAVPSGSAGQPPLSKETVALLARRGHKPIAGGALSARADCSFRDDNGYAGQLQLVVAAATVEQLEARVDVPKHGSCQFRLADFRQISTLPIVSLASQQSACRINIWEQDSQITVAFRDCRAECGGDAVNYLWPILVDSRKGSCT